MLYDLRCALRSLNRSRGFAATAILTLALGIGTATAGFSVLNWLFLRPLPGIADGRRLAVVQFEDTVLAGSRRSAALTRTQSADVSRNLSSVLGLASFTGAELTVGTPDTAFPVPGEFVMPGYFRLLGTRPQIGRLLTDEDDVPGGPTPVAVIGDGIWAGLFHRDPAVVGKSLRINTETFTVVGVAPAGFGGVSGPSAAAVWIPSETFPSVLRTYGEVIHFTIRVSYRQFVTRLAPGASFQQAEAELDARGRHVLGKHLWTVRGVGLPSFFREETVDALGLIMAVTAVVLLVACGNVAGLVLVRGLQQWGPAAMRKVLGASAWDLTRRLLGRAMAARLYGVSATDPASLVLASVVLLVTALAAGWAPARRAATIDPMTELRS